MDLVKNGPPTSLPDWMQRLIDMGFVAVDRAAPLNYMSFAFARDNVLLSLPVAAGLPNVVVYFAAAGIVAAALVAIGSTSSAVGSVVA
jgi:cation/acetate symporter